jgi:hypothetical protein
MDNTSKNIFVPTIEEVLSNVTKEHIELQQEQEALFGNRQDREERKKFAYKIFNFLCAFLVVCGVVLALCAVEYVPFRLSDSVLIALITTTCANVIGIFIFVVKYLFKTN